ncbi:MAG: hypothetical protein JNM70_05660 [Anaerolineae bacterium]|nr:hypothetical protein [Anaerolineae bacterium]
MVPYTITPLSDKLIYIRWTKSPAVMEAEEFIRTLKKFLNEREAPVYFISDLRKGQITNAGTIQKLAELTRHANWAGSTAFGNTLVAAIFVDIFKRLKRTKSDREIWPTPQQALDYLEGISPGVTKGIDWEAVLK